MIRGIHHAGVVVRDTDDVEAECERLEAMGLKVIGKMFDSPFKVAFLHLLI